MTQRYGHEIFRKIREFANAKEHYKGTIHSSFGLVLGEKKHYTNDVTLINKDLLLELIDTLEQEQPESERIDKIYADKTLVYFTYPTTPLDIDFIEIIKKR